MWSPQRLYSQNFEDLYLYRLFSGVDEGFYIDVGAWLPRRDSVTAIFYDQGWRGVNIEPVKEVFDILSSERINDINLCMAVVDDPNVQTVPIMVAGDDPTSWGHHHLLPVEQADSPSIFDRHATAARRDVPASTLREIVEKYAASQQINFLKLDVEGYEHKVLLGLDIISNFEFCKFVLLLLVSLDRFEFPLIDLKCVCVYFYFHVVLLSLHINQFK